MSGSDAYPLPATRRMKDLPLQQQPRELLERFGAENVPDAALLAIILRTGTTGLNVVELADQLLREYGSLSALARASLEDLARWRGMGRVKAQMLKSALELARRMALEEQVERARVREPIDAVQILREEARSLDREVFWMLALDGRNRLKRPPFRISEGTLNASLVHPREVFREAVRANAAAVVVAHNHPSGDPSPSREDVRVTRQLIEASKILQIDLLDHVILGQASEGKDEFFSLRESGLVAF